MDFKLLKDQKKIAFSGEDIKNIIGDCTLITYGELKKYKSIDDLLHKNGICVILYETKQGFGHWCCFFKLNDDMIEFFDPYGLMPDSELRYIPLYFRYISNQKRPHLSFLLSDSKYDIEYNNYRLQKYKHDINTCGRHVCCRLLYRLYDIDEYYKMLKSIKRYNPDDIVTIITEKLRKNII